MSFQNDSNWTPNTWRSFPIKQQPEYSDLKALDNALAKVKAFPPLVHHTEVNDLRRKLTDAAEGRSFLLQGGDCAERFKDCTPTVIENKFKILLQMSMIISYRSNLPVVRIARLAGQYAKPRTSPFETMADGSKVFSFKGDNVNGFDPSNRQPDPERLVDAYFHSAATLNYVRSMTSGGVSNFCSQAEWKLANVKNDEIRQEYETVIEGVQEAIRADDDFSESLKNASLYTSHEGLLLPYEAAQTSKVGDSYYNLGAHYIWIGDRTRDLNGAHIEYFKGISNPIGIKSGPTMTCEDLKALVQKLNPNKEAGRLTIITRYGAAKVKQLLPLHIQAVQSTGIPVLWVCDPCHGNGMVTETGIKTRNLVDMMSELSSTFQIHEECGSRLGGVHLELTGEDVTECLGGTEGLENKDLTKRYETYCDPRLSYTQSLDAAFLIANQLRLINEPTV